MVQTTDYVATVFDGKSNPAKVTVTFTMALNAALKGHSATVILMVEAVELGVPDATQGMDVGKPFEPVQQLLHKYLLIRPNEVLSGIAHARVLKVADHTLRIVVQHPHMRTGCLA